MGDRASRGIRIAPENTLAAFRRAVELGAGFIETDLQLTRDRAWWRCTMTGWSVRRTERFGLASTTLSDLRRLDAGVGFRRRRASFIARKR